MTFSYRDVSEVLEIKHLQLLLCTETQILHAFTALNQRSPNGFLPFIIFMFYLSSLRDITVVYSKLPNCLLSRCYPHSILLSFRTQVFYWMLLDHSLLFIVSLTPGLHGSLEFSLDNEQHNNQYGPWLCKYQISETWTNVGSCNVTK